eukprot:2724524-Rhodomonas_salina.1
MALARLDPEAGQGYSATEQSAACCTRGAASIFQKGGERVGEGREEEEAHEGAGEQERERCGWRIGRLNGCQPPTPR